MHDLIQGSEEWKQARIGSLGASVIHEVMAKTKSGYSTSRANRLAALLLERLTGNAQDIFVTKSMQQGKDREPEAREYYRAFHSEVFECGIYKHPSIPMTHASPDGLVGEQGLLEIKCPEQAEHLDTLLRQTIYDRYIIQMQWQMRCTNRLWCDYLSYNPDFPPHLRAWVKRVHLDTERITYIENEVVKFMFELDAKWAQISKLYGEAA